MIDYVGYFGKRGKSYADSDIKFYDGMLYVIYASEEGIKVYSRLLDADFDEDEISLEDILKDFPHTIKVVFDSWTKGVVLNYGNHPDIGWETVGTTIGFA